MEKKTMTKREICERLMDIYELEICERLMRIYDDTKTFKVAEFDQVAADIKHLILDLAEPDDHIADADKKVVYGLDEGDPKGDESVIIAKKSGDKAWYDICPWRIPGKNEIGVECSPLHCSQCVRKPESPEVPYKGVEKIVDPTGKNPTSYKCPFCNSYTITKTFRDIAGYLDGTCDHCGRTFTLEDKIL